MIPFRRGACAAWCLATCVAAFAADDAVPPPGAYPPAASASAPASASAASASGEAPKPKPYEWKWEGAIGPVLSVSPSYSGSSTRKFSLTPGYYLRYGRITISNTSGFVTRRNNDDIFRGLAVDMKRTDNLRLNVSLRLDNGRRSADATGLAGIENVRRTIRSRASATWQLEHGNKLAIGWNTDLLGRGGGNIVDVGASHDARWSERTTWSVGLGMSAADRRYMQSWYGVTPSESLASGYAAYSPNAGMLDASVGVSWRMEVDKRWIGLWGMSGGRLLGPAGLSPLTTSRNQWRANAGVAWIF